MEREEDGGGTTGETFTDYVSVFFLSFNDFSASLFIYFFTFSEISCGQRPPKLSVGPSHPDPVVETSSLSAVQPPEPTYDLKIKDDLECSKALSCLQIETLVYACQVAANTGLVVGF